MYRIKSPTLSPPNMLLRPRNSGPSEREDGGNGTGSDSGNGDGHNRIAANGNQFTNSTGTPGSTSLRSSGRPNSGLRSLIGSRDGSSPFPPTPPVDTRQQYKGFPFVFETDAYHCTETVYGNESGDCIRYLKPIHRVQRLDLSTAYQATLLLYWIQLERCRWSAMQCESLMSNGLVQFRLTNKDVPC